MWREIIGLLNTGATTGATVAPCKTSQKRIQHSTQRPPNRQAATPSKSEVTKVLMQYRISKIHAREMDCILNYIDM